MSPTRETQVMEMGVEEQLMVIRLDSVDVHCLNPLAAVVYRACDGDRDEAAIAALLAARIAAGDFTDDYAAHEAEAIVETTLRRLVHGGLIRTDPLPERRQFLIEAGRTAAFAALVTSTMIPSAHASGSGPCNGLGTHDLAGRDCRSNAGCCPSSVCFPASVPSCAPEV